MSARFARSSSMVSVMMARWLLTRRPVVAGGSAEAGLTLIECLIAIIVVAITIVSVTPPLFMAAATRVQTRRADQAQQIAQSEVDRVKLTVERGAYTVTELPPIGGADIKDVAAPSGSPSSATPILSPTACTNYTNRYPTVQPTTATGLIMVDVDGDPSGTCTPEFVMQVFRTTGITPAGETAPIRFDVGVRVYTYFPNRAFPTLQKEQASLSMTTGRRDLDPGTNQQRAMAVYYSTMMRNDSSKTIDTFSAP